VFKNEDGKFIRANELQPKKVMRIDKEVDAHYSGKLREMWDWMGVVLPIMGEQLRANRDDYVKALTEKSSTYWRWEKNLNVDEMRAILDDAEHPKRVALAVVLANVGDAVIDGRFAPQPDSFKKARIAVRRVADVYQTEMC
jgi:hypothetical protein